MVSQKEQLLGDYSFLINDSILLPLLNKLQVLYKNDVVFPNKSEVFRAFKLCKYKDLKLVILGQDPYPQKGYATGLAFANPNNTKVISPSLDVIFQRLIKDYPFECYNELPFDIWYNSFDVTLESWASQGVLLLNSSLTVEENKVGSHSYIWYPFIKELIEKLSEFNSGIIYMLFGREAKKFKPLINKQNNYILEYNHPAYYARLKEEFDCDGFIESNKILKNLYKQEIKWIN